jgi:hypothetical protein
MTGQERDYEAILSRVLHTTTDQFEPVGDGLTKIRERLREPWLKRQWWLLCSELMVLRWFVVVRCESFFSKIRSRSDVTDLAPDESADQQAANAPLQSLLSMATSVSGKNKKQQRSMGQAMAWLRPAFAVAGAVVLVVAGVFALGNIQQGFGFLSGSGSPSQTGTSSQTGQNGNTQGGGNALHSSGAPSLGHSGSPAPGTSTAHNKTVPSPGGPCVSASPPVSSPSPAPSPTSASPTPTPTSTSPTPTPTASPTTSTSQAPITSGIAGHSPQGAIGTTALVVCQQTPGASPSPSNQAPAGP